jgi:quinol monooxygenase YgiN
MIVRVFDTAVDPADVAEVLDLFRSQVKPTLEGFEGCKGIEMMVGVEERSGDLVDVLAISRWDSLEAIDRAVGSPDYSRAMTGLRRLFQRTPIVRHFDQPGLERLDQGHIQPRNWLG